MRAIWWQAMWTLVRLLDAPLDALGQLRRGYSRRPRASPAVSAALWTAFLACWLRWVRLAMITRAHFETRDAWRSARPQAAGH